MLYEQAATKRSRRYRAAIYAQCASARDVSSAFDRLTEMMLSEKREDYKWGALIDLAPSSLFRTFGDREIEDCVKKRFTQLCETYPECGFFCLLRSRRYGKNGNFRCEGGIYGALRSLLSGKDDGCTLRMCTDDKVAQSDRVFLYSMGVRDPYPLLPGDITRASFTDGTVVITDSRTSEARLKRRLLRAVEGKKRGIYRVIAWVTFPLSQKTKLSAYRIPSPSAPSETKSASIPQNGISALSCTSSYFKDLLTEWESKKTELPPLHTEADLCAAAMTAYISHCDLGIYGASELKSALVFLIRKVRSSIPLSAPHSPGFLRLSLLLSSAFCDGMGQHGEEFYALAFAMRAIAEEIRVKYESSPTLLTDAPSCCETLAFRTEQDHTETISRRFTAPNGVCDCFLYLFTQSNKQQSQIYSALLTKGFSPNGIISPKGSRPFMNSLLASLYAQMKNGLFSRLSALIPELRGCTSFFRSLPGNGWKTALATP